MCYYGYPKVHCANFTLRLKGDLPTTHPPTHNDTNSFYFWQMIYRQNFAIGLEGLTKLKNMAILPKTLCAINK
jgi:hypothetical protein